MRGPRFAAIGVLAALATGCTDPLLSADSLVVESESATEQPIVDPPEEYGGRVIPCGYADTYAAAYTAPDSVCAAFAVLAYTNQLAPDAALVRRVAADLQGIRSLTVTPAYVAVRPADSWAHWVPGALDLTVDRSALDEIALGAYHHWDGLNERYGACLEGIHSGPMGNGNTVVLSFPAIVHPARLADEYALLPGVSVAYAQYPVGDPPMRSYFELTPDTSRYVFSTGRGDCPSGCTQRSYTFYRVTESGAELVGALSSGAERPDWWDEAERTMEAFRAGPDGS